MKYIDADKLIAKIKELNLVTKTYEEQVAFNNALAMVVEIIDSLKQEHSSLSSNLEEAAKKYANKEHPDEPSVGQWGTGDYEPPIDREYPREIAKDAFKEGAKWMAEQSKKLAEI